MEESGEAAACVVMGTVGVTGRIVSCRKIQYWGKGDERMLCVRIDAGSAKGLSQACKQQMVSWRSSSGRPSLGLDLLYWP